MFSRPHFERVRFGVNKQVKGLCYIKYPNGAEDILDCKVDTGADYTVIPQKFWKPFIDQQVVDKLPKRPMRGVGGRIEAHVVDLALQLSGAALQSQPFDIGTCQVFLALDEDAAAQDQNRVPMKQVLFGIGGGALAKGGLCINWKEGHASFIEVV